MKISNISDNKLLTFLKSTSILIVANMFIKAINFFLLPLYTKYLTPYQLGVSDSITNLASFVFPLLVMGLDGAFSAFYYDERSENHHNKVFNNVLFSLIIASAIPFIIVIFSSNISDILFNTTKYGNLVGICLVSISINLWHLPFSILARMRNKMFVFAAANITASFIMIMLNIFFVSYLQLGEYSLIISVAIMQLIQLIIYLIFLRVKVSFNIYDTKFVKKMLKYSLPLLPTTISIWILKLSDRFIILHYWGESEVGIYGISIRFSTIIAMISSAVYVAYTSFAFDKKDDINAKSQYVNILNGVFIVLSVLAFTVSLFSKEIVILMTEQKYHSAYLLIAGLLFAEVLFSINTIVGYGISFVKKSKYFLYSTAVGATTNIILNFIFIPKYGALAASYTTLASFFVMTTLTYIFANKLYPCPYNIGRILIVLIIAIFISIAGINLSILIKIIIWLITSVIFIYIFKSFILNLIQKIKGIFKKQKVDE